MFSTFLPQREFGAVASNKLEDPTAAYCYYSKRRTGTLLRGMSVSPFVGVGIRVDNGEIIIVAFVLGKRERTRMGDDSWRLMTRYVLFEPVVRYEEMFIERKTQAMILGVIEDDIKRVNRWRSSDIAGGGLSMRISRFGFK